MLVVEPRTRSAVAATVSTNKCQLGPLICCVHVRRVATRRAQRGPARNLPPLPFGAPHSAEPPASANLQGTRTIKASVPASFKAVTTSSMRAQLRTSKASGRLARPAIATGTAASCVSLAGSNNKLWKPPPGSVASGAPTYPSTAVKSRDGSVTSSQFHAWVDRMEHLEAQVRIGCALETLSRKCACLDRIRSRASS